MDDKVLQLALHENFGSRVRQYSYENPYGIVKDAIKRSLVHENMSALSAYVKQQLEANFNDPVESYRHVITLYLMIDRPLTNALVLSSLYALLKYCRDTAGIVLYLNEFRKVVPADYCAMGFKGKYLYYDNLWLDRSAWCLFDKSVTSIDMVYDYAPDEKTAEKAKEILSLGFIGSMYSIALSSIRKDSRTAFWIYVDRGAFSDLYDFLQLDGNYSALSTKSVASTVVLCWKEIMAGK